MTGRRALSSPEPVEVCETCRFDAAAYDLRDALGTLRAIGPMWLQTVEGIDPERLAAAPGRGHRSVVDHALEASRAIDEARSVLTDLARIDDDTGTASGAPDAVGGVGEAADRLLAAAQQVGPASAEGWARTAAVEGVRVNGAWTLRHALHGAIHHLRDAGRVLHLLGAGAPAQVGVVAQISTSDGGVPKHPVDEAEIGERGVLGDRQAARQHHGRPLQALCLWSSDVLDDLRAEGHPIAPGAAGENLTLAGLDWSTIRPGTRLLIGEVLAEVSAYAQPCKKNARWFTGGDFNRMSQAHHPGWSRVYAWVLEPGRVRTGDPVTVEP
jgi:MOSC domain-containing protein YiiM